MADKKITRRLHIYVNGKEIERTLSNLRKEHAKAKAQLNRSPIGSDQWKKANIQVNRLGKELAYAKKEQLQFLETSKKTNKVVDDSGKALVAFTGNFSKMMQGYATGDLIAVREGFHGIKTGIKSATKSAWAFIATPIGAAIAVLAGVGLAAKAWFDYNSQVVEALKLTNSITGLTDKAADKARINAETLQEVYGANFEKTLTTAKTLVAQFGISYDEAFATIEDGLKRGQGKNEEYFDSLGEYGTFFESAGYSVKDFKNIISTGYDLSIYKDKLPDALKEADLALKEQSKSTKEALVNAFGVSFSEDLLKRIRTGKTTTKDALEEIATKSKTANLNQQQYAQLTADVFKGAGEDVGGAAKVFEALRIATKSQHKPLTESQKLLEDQAETTRQLKEVSSSLFATGDKGFGLIIDKAKLFGTKVLVQLLTKGVDIINWFIDMNNQSGAFAMVLKLIGKSVSASFSILGIVLKNAVDGFKGLGNIIEGIFTLDPNKIASGVKQSLSVIPNLVKDVASKAKNDFKELQNAFNGGVKIERITLDTYSSGEPTATSKSSKITKSGLSPEQIKASAEKVKLAKKTEEEISNFLKKESEKRTLVQKEGLAKDLELVDQKYAAEIEKAAENDVLTGELIAAREQAKNDIILQKEAELKEELDILTAESEELLNLKKYDDAIENAVEREDKERAIINRAHFIAKTELEIDREKELAKLDGVENAEKLKAQIRKKYQLKEVLVEKGFSKAKKQVKKDEVVWEKLTTEQKTNLVKDGIGQAAGAFNKGSTAWKAAKIAETTIATYQSAVASYNSLANIPVVGVGLGIAAAAAAVRTGFTQISAIKNTKSEKMPTSFNVGGFTDGLGTGYRDETGEEVANAKLHTGEYVIPRFVRSMPEVPAIIQWLDEKRTNKIRGYADGGDATPNNSATITEQPTEIATPTDNTITTALMVEIERLNNHLDDGLKIHFTAENEIDRQRLQKQLDKIIKTAQN